MEGRTDVDQLRQAYPGWEFGITWATAASGPDRRLIVARCGGMTVSGWDAADLRRAIEAAGS